jgi:hypothetical protein
MKTQTRRGFVAYLKNAALLAPVIALLDYTTAYAAAVVYKAADLAETKKNPSIAALKYVKDATKATTRTVAKGGVAGKDQTCVNCNFYKEPGTIGKEAVGKCLMLQNQLVHGPGWCSVWAKMP